ncbi:MAG: energy-coupling factor ABC transporter ATP-binding protein [Burkholderiaceae bacterium]|jgi:cobalt/nickel transport system ATP-binding protein|nr:energy-coupling factor ABC transporter ATP-binding protein [Burkholderiaceae bacterium]
MIRLREVSLRYPDGHLPIRDLSHHIPAGRRTALLGANGAGKTSLLLALVGLLPLHEGSARIADIPLEPARYRDIRQKIGLVFQNPDDQFFSTSVENDVVFGLHNLGLSAAEIQARTTRILHVMQIVHLRERSPGRLSGGEKRKVALAGVLVMEPEIILLDEPTAYLDPRSRRELCDVLRALPQTVVVATHDVAFAEALCSHAMLLRDGCLVQAGEMKQILEEEEQLLQCGLC